MKKLILPLTLSAFLPVSALAAKTNPVEIVITAKGQQSLTEVAATSHVILRQEIENSQSNDLLEILDNISGISISRNGGRGNASSIFIRGANSQQIIVLVDGIRISSATLGSTELGHIPIELIERIEIVKGPLSGLYGADAIGGVIQIFTKKDGSGKSSIKLEAGSFGHTKALTTLNTDSFLASITHEENNGIDAREISSNGNDDDDGFEETSIHIGSNFTINDSNNISINAFYTENEVEFDSDFGSPENGFVTENEISTISANINSEFNPRVTWSNTLGLTNNDSYTEAFNSQADTQRLSLTSQVQYAFSPNNLLIVGSDYYDEKITTRNDFPVTDRDNFGIFTQLQNRLGHLSSVVNIRVDNNSAYGSDTNGSLALTYSMTNNTSITASYGTAFRAPTFNELYFPGFGNVDIQPEESESFEISLRGNIVGSKRSTQWRISAYDTTIRNLIEAPAPDFIATNTNQATLQGIEFEVGTNVGQWVLLSSLNLLDATDKATGNELIRRPEQTLKISINRVFRKLSLGINFLAENGRFDSEEELNSFERTDFKAAYKFTNNFNMTAKIGNVFDENYQLAKGFNTERRSLVVSAKIDF